MADIATLGDIHDALHELIDQSRRFALVPPTIMTAFVTFKSSSATSIRLINTNPARRALIVVNTDANDLWLLYGAPATKDSGGWTVKIPSAAVWEMPQPVYSGIISGIWTAAGSGVAEITEL